MEEPVAILDWSLRVDCPKCKKSNDLSGLKHDSEYTISQHIFTNAWHRLEGREIICERCGHEFELARVES